MLELNDVVLEGVSGGRGGRNEYNIHANTENTVVAILHSFSAEKSGGVNFTIAQGGATISF